MRRLSWVGWCAALAGVAVWWVVGNDFPELASALVGDDLPAAFAALASAAALVVASWILLLAVLVIVAPRASRRVAPHGLHRSFVRRAAVVGALSVLTFAPSHADSGQRAASGPPPASINGLLLPDRPAISPVTAPAAPTQTVTVRPGDTLWGIAARHVTRTATDAEIAAATAEWYLANRDVIGADPNLIHPEQVLTPPKDRP